MECAEDVLRNWDLLTYSFDSFYPDWHHHPERMVFIPEFLNIQGYEPGHDAAANITEYLAQSRLFSTLQQIQDVQKLGGIYVARFDMDKVSKKIRNLKKDLRGEELLLKDWRTWVTKRSGNSAEDNILLMHPQLGIVLLPVNPAPVDNVQFQERADITKKTAGDAQQVLSDLFCILTNSQTCDIEIRAIISQPEANGEESNHIYKTQVEDIGQMAAFWTARIGESIARHSVRNYYEDPKFQKFARFMVSYRSSVTISARNAHEIYHHREMKTVWSPDEEGGKSVFCLHPRQLSSYLSVNRHQVLLGLPGTGKTFLLMLLATEATLENRSGKVCVVAGGRGLVKKYVKSFENIKSQKRQDMPIVKKNMELADISDADHFFADEMQSVTGDWLGFLQRRAELKGVYTVIVVSGRAWSIDVDQMMVSVSALPELRGYHTLNLKTVVRGTRCIVEYWTRKYLQSINWMPSIGHDDQGVDVIEEVEGTTGGVLFQVKKHILRLEETKFARSDIAVIAFNKHAADDIIQYLTDQKIGACLAGNWTEDHVMVDYNNNVLSQEYPAVIVVNYYGYLEASEWTEFTALTRAIERLVVIKKNRMIIQREIDEIMKQPKNQGNLKVDMARVVQQAADILNAKEQTAIDWKQSLNSPISDWSNRLLAVNHWDQSLAELRYNVLPRLGLENDHFHACEVYSDTFQVLIDNEEAMLDFLRTNVHEDHPFYSYKVAHSRLQQFDYEIALGPSQIDVRNEEMKQVLLRFRERYLESLNDFLKHASEEEREKKCGYLYDKIKWQAITRTVFTLG